MKIRPLFSRLAAEVGEWRAGGYQCEYPQIGEILRFQYFGENADGELRFLRAAQFVALETYWYLRAVKNTPHILALYREHYPNIQQFADALGAPLSKDDLVKDNTMDGLVARIRDPQWAKENRIDALHESATLAYPGYIFALAMGAGKTILIGAIIATEFAMAMTARERGGADGVRFMQNALVFAPGKTIIESLREIAEMPADKILPPGLFRLYAANVKIEYARDNQKDFAAQRESVYNIIVSNTEKIHLRARAQRGGGLNFARKQAEAELTANLRLQKIASLPNLGVFSDEAHHTYGNKAGDNIKRVRDTVNYIHDKTPLVAVVNTTGTPYYKRKMLPEVVDWYGLDDGIRDNVLKSLQNGVRVYDMRGANAEAAAVRDIVRAFYKTYKNTRLPDGARAKIAFYFKTQEHLDDSKPVIEQAMAELGEPAADILVNTQQSSKQETDDFRRLNDPANQKRVILLVQKGKEGWNCPSLFACALVKRQTSDVFVLQAATRCLRQVPGNTQGATVFLSSANRDALENALQENFGMRIQQIDSKSADAIPVRLEIRKTDLPTLEITRIVKRVARKKNADKKVVLSRPTTAKTSAALIVRRASPNFAAMRILQPGIGDAIALPGAALEYRAAAARIAANYHLPLAPILRQLQELYPKGEIPAAHFPELLRQIEEQTRDYEEQTEKIKEVLALIRETGKDGAPLPMENGVYVHRLRFAEHAFAQMQKAERIVAHNADCIGADKHTKEPLFAAAAPDTRDLSYHYSPYCLDSAPEGSFFRSILAELNENPDDIRAFLFTGLDSANITDFYFHYKDADGAYRPYFPDFLLLKNSGEFYVVEIKAARDKDDPTVQAKAKAVEELARMPENRFRYAVIYADGENIPSNADALQDIRQWIRGEKG